MVWVLLLVHLFCEARVLFASNYGENLAFRQPADLGDHPGRSPPVVSLWMGKGLSETFIYNQICAGVQVVV